MKITFPHPTECQHCGFHNFKIHGVVYNGDPDYLDVKVKCMRCGRLDTRICTK